MSAETPLHQSEVIAAAVNRAAWELARRREDALREAAREYLPRPLRWSVDHPRILRRIYRFKRSWAPRIFYGADLGSAVAATQRKDGTLIVGETFRIERSGS